MDLAAPYLINSRTEGRTRMRRANAVLVAVAGLLGITGGSGGAQDRKPDATTIRLTSTTQGARPETGGLGDQD